MKLSRLFKIGAAALMVTSLCFTGCKDEEDEEGIIEVSGKKATINYTNESTEKYARAFHTLNLDRTDATCKITLDVSKSTGAGGVLGFMFNEADKKVTADDVTALKNEGLEDSKADALLDKKYYDFAIAGVGPTNPVTTNKPRTYVSVFEGVDPDTLSSGNSFLDLTGEDAEIEDYDSASTNNAGEFITGLNYTATDNIYTIYIKMAVQDDGSIQLDYYKDSDYTNNVLNESATAVRTITLAAADTGLSEKTDGGIGFYANVYGASTLVGSWEFFDLSGNAIEIEE